jgi:hypothetical protein
VGVSVVLSVSPKRRSKLAEIIFDLEKLQSTAPTDIRYAIAENIAFFKSTRTFYGFCYWALTRRNKIDAKRLLEIADLPLPRWEKELYNDLSYVERKEFPGLSKPLKKLLIRHITQEKETILLDLGCGSMEVERQCIVELSKMKAEYNPIFLGIDAAPQALDAIQSNFASLKGRVDIAKIESLNDFNPGRVDKPTMFFYCGDALEVAELLGHKYSLIFSSRFKHHLDDTDKRRIDSLSQKLTHYVIEYDDYRTAMSWLPPVITAWYRPVLLGAAIFSQIRQPSKKELLKQKSLAGPDTRISLFNLPGSYAKVYLSEDKIGKTK